MEHQQLTGFRCRLGEGPIWDERKRLLWWTDIPGAVVYTYDPADGKVERAIEGKNVGGFALCGNESVLCACLDGLYLWKAGGGFSRIASDFEGHPLRFNDCTTDARGRLLAGTRYLPETAGGRYELGSLYRFDNDGSASILEREVHLSNGLGFSPDNRILYYTDSLQRVIYRYDYDLDKGELSNRGIFAKIPDDEGMPDGLTVDSRGCVWSARWDDEHIVCYDPEGTVERTLPSPFRKTTSLAFGGEDLSDLYITTAAESAAGGGESPGAAASGGYLYRVPLGIRGRIEHRADILWERER